MINFKISEVCKVGSCLSLWALNCLNLLKFESCRIIFANHPTTWTLDLWMTGSDQMYCGWCVLRKVTHRWSRRTHVSPVALLSRKTHDTTLSPGTLRACWTCRTRLSRLPSGALKTDEALIALEVTLLNLMVTWLVLTTFLVGQSPEQLNNASHLHLYNDCKDILGFRRLTDQSTNHLTSTPCIQRKPSKATKMWCLIKSKMRNSDHGYLNVMLKELPSLRPLLEHPVIPLHPDDVPRMDYKPNK